MKPDAAVDDWEAIASDEEKGEEWRMSNILHSTGTTAVTGSEILHLMYT